jgi:hypothetical protein
LKCSNQFPVRSGGAEYCVADLVDVVGLAVEEGCAGWVCLLVLDGDSCGFALDGADDEDAVVGPAAAAAGAPFDSLGICASIKTRSTMMKAQMPAIRAARRRIRRRGVVVAGGSPCVVWWPAGCSGRPWNMWTPPWMLPA